MADSKWRSEREMGKATFLWQEPKAISQEL
jgi:hypothetical protein